MDLVLPHWRSRRAHGSVMTVMTRVSCCTPSQVYFSIHQTSTRPLLAFMVSAPLARVVLF